MTAIGKRAASGALLALLTTGTPLAAQDDAVCLFLHGGDTVLGEVVHVTRNTLLVRRDIGGVKQIPRGQVERVEVDTVQGGTVSGTLAGWKDGQLGVADGDQVLWLKDRQIVARSPADGAPPPAAVDERLATAQDTPPPAPPSADSLAVQVPASAAPPPAPPSDEPAPAAEATDTPPQQITPAVSPPDDALDSAPAVVAAVAASVPVVSARPIKEVFLEGAGDVVFEVRLSRAVDDPVTVIYATVDGGAVEGSDYVAQQGLLTLPAGETTYTLSAPLIDDGEVEGEEQFHLFLTARPGVAQIERKWIPVVIRDDDGPSS